MNKPLNPELIYRSKNNGVFPGTAKTAITSAEKSKCISTAHYILSSIADKH